MKKVSMAIIVEIDDGLELDINEHLLAGDSQLLLHSNKIGTTIGEVTEVFWAIDPTKEAELACADVKARLREGETNERQMHT